MKIFNVQNVKEQSAKKERLRMIFLVLVKIYEQKTTIYSSAAEFELAMSFSRYGSRFLTINRSTVGYLARYGLRLKTETENGVFLLRCDKCFSLKTGKRYGIWLR